METIDYNDPFYILKFVGNFFKSIYETYIADTITPFLPVLEVVSITVSLLFFAGTVFCVIKIREIQSKEYKKYKAIDIEKQAISERDTQWEIVMKHMDSDNPAEWKLAIIEADSILDDIMKDLGYDGDNLGERLKSVNKGEHVSIEYAWEAHKVRNAIAHEGTFSLNRREARRIVGLYEKSFKGLGYL